MNKIKSIIIEGYIFRDKVKDYDDLIEYKAIFSISLQNVIMYHITDNENYDICIYKTSFMINDIGAFIKIKSILKNADIFQLKIRLETDDYITICFLNNYKFFDEELRFEISLLEIPFTRDLK
jgi:hypothetical protein